MLCTRCGRKTHYASSCYAGKHIKGYSISKKEEKEEEEEEEEDSSDEEEYHVADEDGRGVYCFTTGYNGAGGGFNGHSYDEEIEDGRGVYCLTTDYNGAGGGFNDHSYDEEYHVADEEGRGVYCLELNNGKYYIGKSEDIDSRIGNHEKGRGSAWTKLHGVVKEIPTITPHMDDLESWERCETIEMALRYGIENVRGHIWTRITLHRTEIVSFEAQACERMDLCRKCGRGGHMIMSCRAKGRASWMTPVVKKRKIENVKDEPVKKKSNGWKKQRKN